MLKAAAGAGIGMAAWTSRGMAAAFATAVGVPRPLRPRDLYVEKYLERRRHVEIQVFGDARTVSI